MTKVMAIGAVNARRFVRDRTSLFYVLVLPMALILILGIQFGGDPTPRLGVTGEGGVLLDQLRAEDNLQIVEVEGAEDLVARVESGDLDAGIVVPAGLSAPRDLPVSVGFVAATSSRSQQLRAVVDEALAEAIAVPTAERAAIARGAEPAEAAATTARLAPSVLGRVEVHTRTAGDRLFPEGLEGYDIAAPSQLVLFVFVTGLTGSVALIQTRQLGISSRMLSTPTSPRTIIAGEALGRLAVCLFQGVYVLVATLLVFGVDWGDPLGAAAVVIGIAAASAGAAMLFGTLFSRPEQASGIGLIVGLSLAAVGGAMMPIELFSDTIASIARLTPHFWALDAFAELIRHGATLVDIVPQLTVLVLYAAALVLLASWRMRVVLTAAQ